MSGPRRIGAGTAVTLHYRIALEDGTEVDSTFGQEPLTFAVGDGTLVHGLEQVLYGLEEGAQRTFLVGPDQAFGQRDETSVHTLPRSDFAPDMPLEPGFILGFDTPSGEEIPGTVLEVGEEEVRVDFNHPLAGRNIVFEVRILAVSSSAK